MTPAPLIVTSATRLPAPRFWQESALGQSLHRLGSVQAAHPLKISVAFENTAGLPTVYNRVIDAAPVGALLVFVHDDVWIEDYFFAQRVAEGLQVYDAIGVAGNRRRLPGQPAWAFVNSQFTWDERTHLSGSVGHGQAPFGPVSHFGPSPADCELLDGVLLAARADALKQSSVRFDERFAFHFYDMDFCRSARQQGLSMGTWPLAITHQSGGAFGTESWKDASTTYFEKWKN